MRVLALVTSVVASCVLLAPLGASAAVKHTPTTVALAATTPDSLSGQLRSSFNKCLSQRKVTLLNRSTGIVFGSITTARNGSFSALVSDIPADVSTVTVRAEAKRIGSRQCDADTANVTFDQPTLTGGPSGGAFRGVLGSTVDACEPGRRISLFEISSDPVFVGWNLTDAWGAWTIAQAGGTYYAEAGFAFVGAGDDFAYCRAVASPSWSFEDPPQE